MYVFKLVSLLISDNLYFKELYFYQYIYIYIY